MIQINLVPDIKQEMLRAQRMRNVAISLSILVGMIAVGVVVALLIVLGAQVGYQKVMESKVNTEYNRLSGTQDINNALTIQNQLAAISGLNDKRTVDSRLLDVLTAINPASPNDVKLSKVTLDPTQSTLTLEGSAAGGYPATEVFQKTILNTTVTSQPQGDASATPTTVPLTDPAGLTLQNTSYGQDQSGAKVVRFTVVLKYPTGLFDNSLMNVKITAPSAKKDVTDSTAGVPDTMFGKAATELKGNQ